MTDFQSKRIPVVRSQRRSLPKPPGASAGRVMGVLFLFVTGGLALGLGLTYFVFLSDLPAISKLESDILPESSIIYDRNGNELYNMYSTEKRRYAKYSAIDQDMVHAIVAAEDKTFFENAGIDFKGLVRSVLSYFSGKTDRISGTSTISQQLIRNVFLTTERSLDRKVKEMYLSFLMTNHYSKEKILEIYLNKISFGSNASGVDQAARTFFGKPVADISPLEASILASIPKGPTYYSPYTQRLRLMGGLSVISETDSANEIKIDTPEQFAKFKPFVDAFRSFVTNLRIEPVDSDSVKICGADEKFLAEDYGLRDGCATIGYTDLLAFLGNIRVPYDALVSEGVDPELSDFTLHYTTGRKDFVLGRMFQDGYIDAAQYAASVTDAIAYQFVPYREDIKYPHFVFYVQEYLEREYGLEFLDQGGLKIYTTLDPKLQDKAQELVTAQAAKNATAYAAKDAGLVSIDNASGQILAMVGGTDYFGEGEGSRVNVMTARRQPGSSFKPLVYALAISKYPIGADTPIYDVRTEFGNWEPKNFDASFLGRMTVKKALGYSRNIPAIKMLDIAGGEAAMVPFARSLGIDSLKAGAGYGLPMAIGTAELEPLELAQAYSVLASGGLKRDATPILKIVDSRGNTLDSGMSKPVSVLSDAAAYIISTILSNGGNRPTEYWNNALTVPGYTVAAKTGTSNADVSVGKTKKILPRDLWTAGYSRDITTVVWTGNLDGSPANMKADGLSSAAPIWRDFMKFALAGKKDRPFEAPESLYTATISSVTGKLASSATPDSFRVRSQFAVEPTEFDSSNQEVEVDALCNGKVTDATPAESVRRGILMDVTPVIEGMRPAWKRAIEASARASLSESALSQVGKAVIVDYNPGEICPRPNANLSKVSVSSTFGQSSVQALGSNYVRIDYTADNPVIRLEIWRGDSLVRSVPVEWEQRSGSFVDNAMFFGNEFAGAQTIRVRAVDRYGYASEEKSDVSFESDKTAPAIALVNPPEGDRSISVYTDQFFNLRFRVDDASTVTAVNLYMDGKLFRILGEGRDFSLPINDAHDFDVGEHTLGIEAIDAARNRGYEEVRLSILAK